MDYPLQYSWASLVAQMVKNPPATRETWVPSLDWEDPLEKRKATHSSILAWRIQWTVQSIREGNGNPLQYSCLENPMDRGAWWAAVHGVAKSRTRLSDFPFTFHFHALEKEITTHSSSCLENPRDRGAWWAAVYGVTQSRT